MATLKKTEKIAKAMPPAIAPSRAPIAPGTQESFIRRRYSATAIMPLENIQMGNAMPTYFTRLRIADTTPAIAALGSAARQFSAPTTEGDVAARTPGELEKSCGVAGQAVLSFITAAGTRICGAAHEGQKRAPSSTEAPQR